MAYQILFRCWCRLHRTKHWKHRGEMSFVSFVTLPRKVNTDMLLQGPLKLGGVFALSGDDILYAFAEPGSSPMKLLEHLSAFPRARKCLVPFHEQFLCKFASSRTACSYEGCHGCCWHLLGCPFSCTCSHCVRCGDPQTHSQLLRRRES